MDSIVSSALTEIYSQGPNGVSISDLWPTLQTPITSSGVRLCNGVKKLIWSGLLNTPGLEFKSQHTSFTSQDSTIQSLEDADKFNLKIVAAEHLRDCFLGIYDFKPPATERAVLERLAVVKTNGITQSQLAREFGMKGNEMFYVLRHLEFRGLIVRRSTIVRTKGNVDGPENTSTVHTNLIHLRRYAKHLRCQQKLEIIKSETLESLENAGGGISTGDGYAGGVKEDVFVKDYLPAMTAICAKLEEADDKVLVASDIKQALDYRKTQGHRSWRTICARLVEARLVEVFSAKVDKKVVNCLRLLKKFDPKYVEPKYISLASDEYDIDLPLKCGKRGQNLDQLLELPMEHQIYDLIDAQGGKGLTIIELCKRLGINGKKNYSRLLKMLPRYGMHIQAENHIKSKQYRVWTSGNVPDGFSNVFHDKHGHSPCHENVDQTIQLVESLTFQEELRSPEKMECGEKRSQIHCSSPGADGRSEVLICGGNSHDLGHDIISTDFDEGEDLVNVVNESISAPSEIPPPSSSISKRRAKPRYPCLMTAESAQREQRILERLQEEKFVLIVELHKWLESLEKDKGTAMDKKTVTRILSKLEEEGLCRCIHVSVPLVTNCGRNRTTMVVLHSSLSSLPNLPPELLSQIQERLRSFEKHLRVQGLARLKDKQVPVLNNVERTLTRDSSDSQAIVAEAMRVNGFVPAKMVRTKLLHNFLWGYLRSSPEWANALYTATHGYDVKNPHSTCKIFTLAVAVKAMPLELFLQVVGSTQKFENLVENSKLGLCLTDLPLQEYTSLMDIQSTARLSSLVGTLCRLKLLRLVTDKHAEDRDKTSDAVFTYAMELKPYIEEPLSRISLSLGINSSDLRPRIRHDFVLSTREAVDIYWKTLEYCYAAADPKSAGHAFPGCSVKEVFLYRSWTSVRVMTADQRAELLKRIGKDDLDKKISFSDCVKIARDLNLTLEQVLRVSDDKRQLRLNKFQDKLNPCKNLQSTRSDFVSASQKRKRSSEATVSMADPEDCDFYLQGCGEDGQAKAADDSGTTEEDREEGYNFVSHCALSRLKPSRLPRFMWTDTSDKELVIQYVRHRAALGARFHRTDWVSLPHLPASPNTCRRRMLILNQNPNIRRAVMTLCNLLGERYAQHLSESPPKETSRHNISRQLDEEFSATIGLDKYSSNNYGEFLESVITKQQWDDFEDQNIKSALDEVMRCKQMAKLGGSKRSRLLAQKECPDNSLADQSYDSQEQPGIFPSITADKDTQSGKRQRRSRCHRLPGKFLKLLNEGISVSRRAYDSLAVANAVELLKLVFLSTSSAPEVPNLLAENLRRYSEHDLFAAFNYLREKTFMVGGNGSQPFVLSQKFLHRASSSPFPTNTGKRAAKFVNWLREREQDLIEDRILLKDDLQCGDIVHLFALVYSGELFISPSLPDEGIGEVEENTNVKRKADDDEICSANNVKRLKALSMKDGDIGRRAKGFPGIKVSVSRIMISKSDVLDLIPDQNIACSSVMDTNDQVTSSHLEQTCKPSYTEIFASLAPVQTRTDGSRWEAMSSYGNQLLSTFTDNKPMTSLNPSLFKTAQSAIYRAGDQGLSMDQIAEVLQGKEDVEFIVDVLLVFGLAVKVNAYDDIRIVDASFRSKYFLTTIEGRYQGLQPAACRKPLRENDLNCLSFPTECQSAAETSANFVVHKVTLLNLPEDVCHLSNQVQTCNDDVRDEKLMKMDDTSLECVRETETSRCMPSVDSHSYRPILPWINGDGTTNPIVYKGLVRRVLGIVMQNPAILDDDIVYRMDVLNPQSCRKLLELMILDNHLMVRKMHQIISTAPPSILTSLCSTSFKKSASVCRLHLFANPMSTLLL